MPYTATMRCTGFQETGNDDQEIILTSISTPAVTMTIQASNPQGIDIVYNQIYRVKIEAAPEAGGQDRPTGTETY